jgi:fumarate hydratase class II
MPGKVNPVIPETVLQIAAQVIGNDTAITFCGQSGNFELNVMMPVMAYNLLQSIELLTNGINVFRAKCITGLKANKKRCTELVEKSLALITVLSPVIGYDKAAEIVKEAEKSDLSLRDTIKAKKILSKKEIKELLDPIKMTEPKKVPGKKTT